MIRCLSKGVVLKKVDFATTNGTISWHPSRETLTKIKSGPFEESGVTAAVQNVLGPLMGSVASAANVIATSSVSGPNELRDLLGRLGKDLEKMVTERTEASGR